MTAGADARKTSTFGLRADAWTWSDDVLVPSAAPLRGRAGTSDFRSIRSTQAGHDGVIGAPVVRPAPQPTRRQFQAVARWEGSVVEVFDTYFTADVIDLDSDEYATAEFDMRELAEFDRPLCRPGALFYWSIGYEVKANGQRSRSSVIRFRRLGKELGTNR